MKDSKLSTSSGSCLLNLDPHFLFSIRSDSYLLFESPNGLLLLLLLLSRFSRVRLCVTP